MAFAQLGDEMTHIEELIGKGKKQISMAEVAIESVAPYAAADAETTSASDAAHASRGQTREC